MNFLKFLLFFSFYYYTKKKLSCIINKFVNILYVFPYFQKYIIRRRIEVAITSLTRNQVVGQPARGFESHRLRLLKTPGAFAGPGVFLISSIPLSHREISHAHRPPQNQSQAPRPIFLPGPSHRSHKSPDIPHVQNHRR